MPTTREEHVAYDKYLIERIKEEIDSGLTLDVAEAELDAFETGVYQSIGIDPDGALHAYLNESDFMLEAQWDRLKLRVSVLLNAKMHAEARALLAGEPNKFGAAA